MNCAPGGGLTVKGPAGRRARGCGADTGCCEPVAAGDVAARKGALAYVAPVDPGDGAIERAIAIKTDGTTSGHVAKARAAEGGTAKARAAHNGAAAKAHAAKAWAAHEGSPAKAHAAAAEAHAAKGGTAKAHTAAAEMAAAKAHATATKSHASAEVSATRGRGITPQAQGCCGEPCHDHGSYSFRHGILHH
jgi:hypothetical protein